MKIEEIGQYQDENTGKTYTVLKRTVEISNNPISGISQKLKGSYDFITSCNIDLNQLDDQLDSFEMIQIDGIIKRVGT